jgi:hypothetical protein
MLPNEKPEPLISKDGNEMRKGQLALLNYETFALASLMTPRMIPRKTWGEPKPSPVTRKYRKDRKRRNKISAASRRRNRP